jgi:aspartyl-tRNA(Asn)/glutamyl-tRNA(Gln) amidotransferase subunit A
MNELAFASLRVLQKKLKAGEITAPELVAYYSKRFAHHDSKIDAALEIFDTESVLKESSQKGVLEGIPGLIKDNMCQRGRITSCGSKILENYNAPYDATAIARLKAAGAPLLGRANMDEFAMGSSTETSAFKKTKNPWNVDRVPGGSSGGSAAAVAAGLVPWALGSETGGSVRQPAALCGIVGLKPTYGLISRYGLVAYASSLDQIGILTREVYDNAFILSTIAGHAPCDSTSLDVRPQDYTSLLNGKLPEGFTLGVIDNALEAKGFNTEVYAALQQVLKTYEELGARIKRLTLPMMDHAAAVYFMVSRAEAASNLARFDGVRYGYRSDKSDTLTHMYMNTRSEGFGLEVKSRILVGNYVLSVGHAEEFYKSAKIVQGLMRDEFIKTFKEVDLLFAPVSPIPAFPFNAFAANSIEMDLQDYFTASSNLTGMPALSIPCGFTKDTLPIGFQLMGPDLSEARIFQAAYAYEQATPWHTMHPKGYE